MRRDPRAARGFTLVELLIVLGIVGVLSAIAYPAYRSHVLRTHRATAAACLQELAWQMERRYTIRQSYLPEADQPALPLLTCMGASAGRYAYTHGDVPLPAATPGGAPAAVPGPTDSQYLVQATPVGAQVADTACGTLGLDHLGTRSRSGTAADVQSCWR